jgi:hypothetical protein
MTATSFLSMIPRITAEARERIGSWLKRLWQERRGYLIFFLPRLGPAALCRYRL